MKGCLCQTIATPKLRPLFLSQFSFHDVAIIMHYNNISEQTIPLPLIKIIMLYYCRSSQ